MSSIGGPCGSGGRCRYGRRGALSLFGDLSWHNSLDNAGDGISWARAGNSSMLSSLWSDDDHKAGQADDDDEEEQDLDDED